MSKKFSKKLKWVIPFAVLSLTCASVGVMAGCKDPEEEHTHVYEWQHNETEHWKECPADGEEEAGTRGEHLFVAGECECGATETVAVKKYGKVTGTVKLHKLGGYETDFTDVTVDMGDEVQPVFDKTTGTFTVDNVEVNKNYSLTVSKSGYQSYSVTVQVPTENETVTIGGQRGIILEYEVFGYMAGYDKEYHDLSHVNDATPYVRFKENDGTKTLNIMSNDSYTDVAATMHIEYNNSLHSMHTQGIVIRYEDGKHVIVRYHNGDQANGNIQYVNTTSWPPDAAANTLFGADANLDQWGENPVHTLTNAETAEIKKTEDGGLDLTLVLNDGKLTVLFDDKYVSEYQLPEGYADKKAQVGFFAWNAASNAIFTYGISTEIPDMQTEVDIDVTQPESAGCTVTVSPEKQKYAFGEELELTVNAASGHMLSALTVNGEDKFTALEDGKLKILADRANIAIAATFVEKEDMALNLTVKGKKLGQTTALAEGTKVSFSGITDKFTVNAEGKITADTIAKARYTVTVDGYIAKDITLNESLTEIVLEYDAFKVLRWDTAGHDLSHVNDDNPYVAFNGSGSSLNVVSKQLMFDSAVVSVIIKGSNSTDGAKQQGLTLQFEDGKAAILNINTDTSDGKVNRLQFRPELFSDGNDATIGLRTAFEQEWVEFKNVTDAEVAKLNSETGIELKVYRDGVKLYVFLDGEFKGIAELPEKYATSKMGFGIFSFGAKKDAQWQFSVSDKAADFPVLGGIAIEDGTAQNAHGHITINPTEAQFGATVTVTVTPDEGYILDKLTVSNGATVTKVNDTTYTFLVEASSYTVTATFMDPTVHITDGTAEDAHGSVSFTEDKIVLGETVTITVTPDTGYLLASITVTDSSSNEITLTEKDGAYSFIAADLTYTITATFDLIPEKNAEATVSGIGLGNTPVSFEGETITVTPATGAAMELTVTDGKISRKLTAGEYTLSKEGYYDVKATVGADGTFEDLTEIKFVKILFKHNMLGDAGIGNANKADYAHAATDGYLTVKESTDMYAFMVDRYEDAVFTATFKKQNGMQGLFMAFGKETKKDQQAVGLAIAGNDFKFYGDWIWGLCPIAWGKWEFGPENSGADYARPMSEALQTKYASEGIKVSYVRKDGALYVFIEDELYAVQILGDYGERDACFAIWAAGAAAGYQIPFTVSDKAADIDKMLADVVDENGARSVLGNWTVTENTLAVTGSGFVEFTHTGVQTQESLTLNLKGENSNAGKKAQGILYHFADGKWIAIRIERGKNNNQEDEAYVQFSEDGLVPTGGGCLKTGWGKAGNRNFTAEEITAFDGTTGLNLSLVRNGRYFYVMLNGELLETVTLDAKYATMDGVIGATMETGVGKAYTYSHATGEAAIPTGFSTVTASIQGEANGYSVSVDKILVKNGESVKVTIETSNAGDAWSYFPNAITVNGTAIDFSTVVKESLGANRCKFTYTLANVTANTAIEVTVAKGTQVAYAASVNNAEQGSIVCDMEALGKEYYWNDLCTFTITAQEGFELEKLVLGEGDDAQEITTGWTLKDGVYTYKLTVTGDIKVVAHFKAVAAD